MTSVLNQIEGLEGVRVLELERDPRVALQSVADRPVWS
jgi:hypothetical protein